MSPFAQLRLSEFSASFGRGPYLNHAGVSPAPDRVVRAVTDAVQVSGQDPMAFFMQHVLPARDGARERLARLLGVPTDHLALVKNTGHGLSLLADALRLDTGDNVVTADCEYPSVVYPWYAQADRGIETRFVPTRPDGTFTPDDFAARMDVRTKVVTLSWVQFGTGFRADVKQFADMAHAHGAILIVDVIQGLGALPCFLERWGVDAAVTGAHKWLLAPGGTGGLYVHPALLERLRLVNIGAASVENIVAFDPLVFEPRDSVQRYEEGTPNGLGLIGLFAALSVLEEAGIDAVADHILSLCRFGAEELIQKGYTVRSPQDDERRAGLLLFSHPVHSNEAVLETLTQAGVGAAVRGGGVRFSPHFYNTEEEMARAVDALP